MKSRSERQYGILGSGVWQERQRKESRTGQQKQTFDSIGQVGFEIELSNVLVGLKWGAVNTRAA